MEQTIETTIETPGTAKAVCDVRWLGSVEYRQAWDLQRDLAVQRLDGVIPDTLLLLEHPPTITLGRAANPEHVIANSETLTHNNVAVIESDRGGDVTYHGPGQIVGYPILNLQTAPHTPDLHRYLRQLEQTLITVCAAFGLTADRFPGYTGVWLNRETRIETFAETFAPVKVAAIGVRASRWITQHGFALNVAPDLSHFGWIVPCGIHDYGVTSLAEQLHRPVTVAEVRPVVARAFLQTFGYDAGAG